MEEDLTHGSNAGQSGWVTTKVAARMLRVDPRTVRKYIKQGKLVAETQGEGVEKTYLVSIDSLHELRGSRPDPRVNRDDTPREAAGSASNADLVDLVRDLSAEVTRRSSEAAELRTRLELTERAESSQREALEQRLEAERILREQAERERDDLLEVLRGVQEAPEPPSARFYSGEEHEDAQEPVQTRMMWWPVMRDTRGTPIQRSPQNAARGSTGSSSDREIHRRLEVGECGGWPNHSRHTLGDWGPSVLCDSRKTKIETI
jgi:hypothetical protein